MAKQEMTDETKMDIARMKAKDVRTLKGPRR